LNKSAFSKETGKYHKLEVITSGSLNNLDTQTIRLIEETCLIRKISALHFECHCIHRRQTDALHIHLGQKGITVKIKTGDEACLLPGIPGQTKESIEHDIQTGLQYFERICINIMTPNSCGIKPDPDIIQTFQAKLYPIYKTYPQNDILLTQYRL